MLVGLLYSPFLVKVFIFFFTLSLYEQCHLLSIALVFSFLTSLTFPRSVIHKQQIEMRPHSHDRLGSLWDGSKKEKEL